MNEQAYMRGSMITELFVWGVHWSPMNLTGRWMIKTDVYGHCLYLEHQGRFLRKWVPETSIKIAPARTKAIFTCESNQK